jgi:hypothetical protein
MRRITLLVFVCIILIKSLACADERAIKVSPIEDRAERRTALVIGNAAYAISPLRNPANDARLMEKTLKKLGFHVIILVDATQNKMKQAIDEFSNEIKKGGVGLFYYAGHGMAFGGHNYLIPVDAKIESESGVETESVDVDRVLKKMSDAGNTLNILMLDSCRNNPFVRSFRSTSRGWATMEAPNGAYISYATTPGNVANDGDGENGPYTSEFAKAVQIEGLKIEDVYKKVRYEVSKKTRQLQIPTETSMLNGDFYFRPPSGTAVSGPAYQGTTNLVKEAMLWESIRDSRNVELFRDFLRQYPDGTLNGLALTRIKELTSTQESSADQPADSVKIVFRSPKYAFLDVNGKTYELEASPTVFFRKGTTPFSIHFNDTSKIIYGVLVVNFINDEVTTATFGEEISKSLFKEQHIASALLGKPVIYGMKVNTENGPKEVFSYKLSLSKIK